MIASNSVSMCMNNNNKFLTSVACCHDGCIINYATGEASEYEIINGFLYYA